MKLVLLPSCFQTVFLPFFLPSRLASDAQARVLAFIFSGRLGKCLIQVPVESLRVSGELQTNPMPKRGEKPRPLLTRRVRLGHKKPSLACRVGVDHKTDKLN
jgi:hypothetical protein